ncbi:hypothetical protein HPB51_016309 [Rhipicephalus microplus]|uniref:Uncharacterized protein n=1 Tax=Rhipicephalus microplus TaxID=6941 RepID=A0A9J6EPA9_RHIMP|nr:hypothetical protein HPB51_016309 [Rhipicephalus microplus]
MGLPQLQLETNYTGPGPLGDGAAAPTPRCMPLQLPLQRRVRTWEFCRVDRLAHRGVCVGQRRHLQNHGRRCSGHAKRSGQAVSVRIPQEHRGVGAATTSGGLPTRNWVARRARCVRTICFQLFMELEYQRLPPDSPENISTSDASLRAIIRAIIREELQSFGLSVTPSPPPPSNTFCRDVTKEELASMTGPAYVDSPVSRLQPIAAAQTPGGHLGVPSRTIRVAAKSAICLTPPLGSPASLIRWRMNGRWVGALSPQSDAPDRHSRTDPVNSGRRHSDHDRRVVHPSPLVAPEVSFDFFRGRSECRHI